MTYKVTDQFLKMFGLASLKDLPNLPKYKLDSNRQVVIDELTDDNNEWKDSDNNREYRKFFYILEIFYILGLVIISIIFG